METYKFSYIVAYAIYITTTLCKTIWQYLEKLKMCITYYQQIHF